LAKSCAGFPETGQVFAKELPVCRKRVLSLPFAGSDRAKAESVLGKAESVLGKAASVPGKAGSVFGKDGRVLGGSESVFPIVASERSVFL
jgi:hypothetical protein